MNPPTSWGSRDSLHDAETEALRSECDALREERDAQRVMIRELQSVGERLNAQVAQLSAELATERRARRESERAHIESEAALEKSVHELRSALATSEGDRVRLRQRVQQMRSELWQRDEAYDSLRHAVEDAPVAAGGPAAACSAAPLADDTGESDDIRAVEAPTVGRGPPEATAEVTSRTAAATVTTHVSDWRRSPPVTAPPPPPWRPKIVMQSLPAGLWAHVFAAVDTPDAMLAATLRATCAKALASFDVAVDRGLVGCAGCLPVVAATTTPAGDAGGRRSSLTPAQRSPAAVDSAEASNAFPSQPLANQGSGAVSDASHRWFPMRSQPIVLSKHWDGLMARGPTHVRVDTETSGGRRLKSVRATAVTFASGSDGTPTPRLPPTLGDRMLYRCRSITRVDLSAPLPTQITAIGQHFLSDCAALTDLSLGGLTGVSSLGPRFCADCTSLRRVELQGLKSVTAAGDGFFFGCSALVTLDMRPMHRLTKLGHQCLASCVALQHVDLPRDGDIESLGSDFLDSCGFLRSFDAAGLASLRTIPSNFLFMCADMTAFSFRPFVHVSSIGRSCLSGCSALTHVDTSGGLGQVTYIGDGWLAGCRALKTVNLRGLRSVQRVGQRFLSGCSSLVSVEFACLSTVAEVGADFCGYCPRLAEADLSQLTALRKIGEGFLIEATSLVRINASGLRSVVYLGSNFFARCARLSGTLDLSAMADVCEIRPGFLTGCSSLHHVKFGALGTNVTEVGHGFLSFCSGLRDVDLTSFKHATVFDPHRLLAGVKDVPIRLNGATATVASAVANAGDYAQSNSFGVSI